MNPNELGLLERLPVPTEAPFPDLGSCQGPERSLGLVICECVLKDICTYIREVPLLAGEGGILVMTEVIVTAGATPCSLCAGPAQLRGFTCGPGRWRGQGTSHPTVPQRARVALPAPRLCGLATVSPAGPSRRDVGSLLLTVCLPFSPDADRVDSTTLLGKAHLDFDQPLLYLPPFVQSHTCPHVTYRGLLEQRRQR